MRTLPFNAEVTPGNLLQRVNAGEVEVAPPKIVPPGVVTVEQVAAAAGGPSTGIQVILTWLPWLLIVIGVAALAVLPTVLPLGIGLAIGTVIFLVMIVLAYLLWRMRCLSCQRDATAAARCSRRISATILPEGGIAAGFNFGVGVSSSQGVYFAGSSGLEIQLPIHVTLGPIDVTSATLTIGIDAGSIPIGLGVTFDGSLGRYRRASRTSAWSPR